jgi:hypothetical protein
MFVAPLTQRMLKPGGGAPSEKPLVAAVGRLAWPLLESAQNNARVCAC